MYIRTKYTVRKALVLGLRTWILDFGLDNKLTQQNNLVLPAELTDIKVEVSTKAVTKRTIGKRMLFATQ